MRTVLATLLPIVLLLPAQAAAQIHEGHTEQAAAVPAWSIDTAHSELTFRIRHLLSRVRGSFDRWEGEIHMDPQDLSAGRVHVTIDAASINTQNERRDAHLRSDDFFDAENHPVIRFVSERVSADAGQIEVAGMLTIRGISRPVVLTGALVGVLGEPGARRAGFEARTTIDRRDFDVSWNRAAELGGMTLGNEVEIEMTLAVVER
jgi:polyisoprenoid-binding protein YceI